MNRLILPGPRSGAADIPASKSRAHRLMICAALGAGETELRCRGISRDILATADCLRGMGAGVDLRGDRILISPIEDLPAGEVTLPCGESGSTLRFLLPVVGALGLEGHFRMEGRLPQRPLQPLGSLLESRGMRLRQEGERLFFSGRLRPGDYAIPGNISSQYISGLLFALPLLAGESSLTVTDRIESADYIAMTEDALRLFGTEVTKDTDGRVWHISGRGPGAFERTAPACIRVEADWSSGAFLLAMGALSPGGITVRGLDPESLQGDRRILRLLEDFGARVTRSPAGITVRKGEIRALEIDASAIPDLVPVLSAVAALAEGETVIRHAERLRMKESDRLQTTCDMLTALGGDIRQTEDGLVIRGQKRLRGGPVSSFQDHRIAMAAAVAAGGCEAAVEVEGAECTDKSFPGFWEILQNLTTDFGLNDAK